MGDSRLELQESGWEELRKEAKKIVADLEVKLSSHAKLGASSSSGYVDNGSPAVGSSRSWKSTEMEIQSLLKKLLDVNDAMSRCAATAAPSTSVTQKIARHKDILHELTQGDDSSSLMRIEISILKQNIDQVRRQHKEDISRLLTRIERLEEESDGKRREHVSTGDEVLEGAEEGQRKEGPEKGQGKRPRMYTKKLVSRRRSTYMLRSSKEEPLITSLPREKRKKLLNKSEISNEQVEIVNISEETSKDEAAVAPKKLKKQAHKLRKKYAGKGQLREEEENAIEAMLDFVNSSNLDKKKVI